MICNKCNHKLPDDSEFCQYCGNKIEKEIESQDDIEVIEEGVEEIAILEEPSVIKESEPTELDDMTPEDALNAVIKIQAEETVKALKENSKNQPNHEEDADFGLVPEKPIYTLALMSVDGEREYLNRLYTENGMKIKWNRRGSTSVHGINGMIDVYDTFLPSGQPYKTIYINMYGAKKSEKAPAGFILKDADATKKYKKPKKQNKVKTKYCSRCGSLVDNETKICSGCGKKYFKGFKFTKFSIPVVVLSLALVISIILNIVIGSKIIYLNDRYDYWMDEAENLQDEISDLESQLWDYENLVDFVNDYVVFVEDDDTNQYHKYECYRFKGNYFWAYNTEKAEQFGYYACPLCH